MSFSIIFFKPINVSIAYSIDGIHKIGFPFNRFNLPTSIRITDNKILNQELFIVRTSQQPILAAQHPALRKFRSGSE
jgi:hypothetical protein